MITGLLHQNEETIPICLLRIRAIIRQKHGCEQNHEGFRIAGKNAFASRLFEMINLVSISYVDLLVNAYILLTNI